MLLFSEILEEVMLMGTNQGYELVQKYLAFPGDPECIGPPVIGESFTGHQAIIFQFIDQWYDGGPIDLDGTGQVRLFDPGVAADNDQRAEMSGCHFNVSQGGDKIPEDCDLCNAHMVADQFSQNAPVNAVIFISQFITSFTRYIND